MGCNKLRKVSNCWKLIEKDIEYSKRWDGYRYRIYIFIFLLLQKRTYLRGNLLFYFFQMLARYNQNNPFPRIDSRRDPGLDQLQKVLVCLIKLDGMFSTRLIMVMLICWAIRLKNYKFKQYPRRKQQNRRYNWIRERIRDGKEVVGRGDVLVLSFYTCCKRPIQE